MQQYRRQRSCSSISSISTATSMCSSIMSTGTSSSRREKKSVTFSQTAKMRLGLHFTEYTDKELHNCYYMSDDFREFRRETDLTADLLAAKNPSKWMDGIHYCSRGVEGRTREATKRRIKQKKSATLAVLKEQLKQIKRYEEYDEEDDENNPASHSLYYDDEKIAAAYAPFVRASAASAYIMGLSDEVVAKDYLNGRKKKSKKYEEDDLSATVVCRVLNLTGGRMRDSATSCSFHKQTSRNDRVQQHSSAVA